MSIRILDSNAQGANAAYYARDLQAKEFRLLKVNLPNYSNPNTLKVIYAIIYNSGTQIRYHYFPSESKRAEFMKDRFVGATQRE